VFGSVPACNSSIPQESVIVATFLDDVNVGQVTQPCGTTDRNNVIFYDSGTLSGGNQPHKLSVVNQLGNCLPFRFDAFFWDADSTTASTTAIAAPAYSISPTTSGSSATVVQGSSRSINLSTQGPATTSAMSGTSLAADAVASSTSKFVPFLCLKNSSLELVKIVTVNGVVTSMIVAPVATGSSDTHGRPPPSTGLIVGCIIGVLLFLILLILLLNYYRRRRNKTRASTTDAITPFQLAEGATNPSLGLPLDPEIAQRRLKFLPPTQDAKSNPCNESSSSAPHPRETEERRPLPDQERTLPSSESQPNHRPLSTILSPPSDMAPAYRPDRSDMSTTAHLDARASRIVEAPPSYDNC